MNTGRKKNYVSLQTKIKTIIFSFLSLVLSWFILFSLLFGNFITYLEFWKRSWSNILSCFILFNFLKFIFVYKLSNARRTIFILILNRTFASKTTHFFSIIFHHFNSALLWIYLVFCFFCKDLNSMFEFCSDCARIVQWWKPFNIFISQCIVALITFIFLLKWWN